MGDRRSSKQCITDLYGSNIVGVDDKVKGQYVIDTFHSMVHDASAFASGKLFSSVANDSTSSIMIQLDSTSYEYHLEIECFSGGDAFVYIYEDCTHTSGTSVSAFNLNRGSSNLPHMTMKHTPSGGVQGTQLVESFIPGGTGVIGSVGSSLGTRKEFLLSPLTHSKYMVVIVNKAGTAAPLAFRLFWYEVEI
jgi:hypothetical protein